MKAAIQSNNQHSNLSGPNTIVLLFFIGFLLMDFLPSFKTIEKTSPQYLYLAILNIIIGVYCYCKPHMLPQNLISIYKKSSLLKIYVSFLFLCGVSVITAGNVPVALVALSKLLIVFCLFINISMLLYNRLQLLYQIAFIIAISVIAQSVMILYGFSKTLDLSGLKGSTGNINILAAVLNIKVAFLALGIVHFSSYKRAVFVLALLLSSVLIFLTGSRATFVALLFQIIIFIVFYFRINGTKKADYIKIACIILPVFMSFFIANTIFTKTGNNDRYKSVESRVGQIGFGDASAQLRLDLWQNATQLTAQKPLLGAGIGNWKIADLPYEKNLVNDSDVSGNTHNDFLELTAETGILNGVIYFSLFVLVFAILIKKIFKNNQKEAQLIAVIALMMLCSYGLDALFNFPLYVPAMQFGFCFLLALTLLNGIITEEDKPHFSSSQILSRILIIGLVGLYFAFSQFKAAQLEYKFKVYQATYRLNNALPETGRLIESADLLASLPKFPTLSYYSEPFIEYVAESFFYEKKYDQALKYFKQAQLLNPYLGNSDWYMHKIAFLKGNTDEAYKYVKIAFYKRPRNRDFYLSALYVANEKKDTLEMLKIHDQFSKYRKEPQNWINTSDALQLSGYSTKNLIAFIDKGLISFPKDSVLTARKLNYKNTTRDQYLLLAQQFGAQQKFDQSLVYYLKVLNEDPENAVAIQNIGICYFNLNQYKQAIQYLLKVENNAALNDGKTQYVLGVIYINMGNKEKACHYLNLSRQKNFQQAEDLIGRFCK